jgi:alginate O-acetyltransferase complex protein AlgI
MNFVTPQFFVFFAIFLLGYQFLPQRVQRHFTVAASFIFYGWWDYRFTLLLAFTIVTSYVAALAIERATAPRRRDWILTGYIVVSLLVLAFFKYFKFFGENVRLLAQVFGFKYDDVFLNIILPVGISFYTFHTMSYVIDVYRRKMTAERNLVQWAEFVAIWPVLVAGPILRASRLLPQLRRSRRVTWPNVLIGVRFILVGYFLKTVLADNLAPYVNGVFDNASITSGTSALCGVLFFSFQIYGDFAGYSLIAIGIGRIMGVNFGRNFHRPYFARDFSDFWRRWHISLSSWLRDYLYISLGGNRRGERRTRINLMLTMLIGGLWHGANWTFVVWGGLHGLLLVIQRLTGRLWRGPTPKPVAGLVDLLRILGVFSCVTVAWIFFRAKTFGQAWTLLGKIGSLPSTGFEVPDQAFSVALGLVLISGVVAMEAIQEFPILGRLRAWSNWRPVKFVAFACMAFAILFMGMFDGAQFIYFAF